MTLSARKGGHGGQAPPGPATWGQAPPGPGDLPAEEKELLSPSTARCGGQ